MKLKIKDLRAILSMLKEDERQFANTQNGTQEWNAKEIELSQTEESVESGNLTSTLKIELKYTYMKSNYGSKKILVDVNTKIEMYDSSEKRDPVVTRTTIHGPED